MPDADHALRGRQAIRALESQAVVVHTTLQRLRLLYDAMGPDEVPHDIAELLRDAKALVREIERWCTDRQADPDAEESHP